MKKNWLKGNDLMLKKCVLLLSIAIAALHGFAIEIDVIKNPKPTMKEKQYVLLSKVKDISADLGNEQYLFRPTSMTIDKNNHLYVYDNLQAKIFKFDEDLKLMKSFGRVGPGPGEFAGTGLSYLVVIKIGRDGKLYANDLKSGKMVVFHQNGEFIREFRYRSWNFMMTPVVDAQGNVYFISVKERTIDVLNEKRVKLFSVEYDKENFNYLFYKPGPLHLDTGAEIPSIDLSMALTLNSRLLILFKNSATVLVLENKKIVNKIRIWPEEALDSYKTEISDLLRRHKDMFKKLFFNLFVDEDNDRYFYLQSGSNKKRDINALYKCNTGGELLKTLYIRLNEPSFTRFKVKKNNLFYGIEDEKITIYKEEKK